MAPYSFHRNLMGKVKIDNFSFLIGDIWNLFLQNFFQLSSTFHMSFVQIAEFIWLPGQQKG